MERIYLDNAASTPLDPEALQYMIQVLQDYHGNPSSVHANGRQLRALIEKSRKEIAELIGAAPGEIFFTSGGTEADNIAIKCTVATGEIDQVISSPVEHHAVTYPVAELEKSGTKVTWLPVDGLGRPDLNALEDALKNGGKALVSLMHANNELGTLIDFAEVAGICEKYGAVFHSDTVQTIAHVQYKLSAIPVNFLSASAHKFYGPKGAGFLYMRSGMKIPSLICGGSQERNIRAGTENVAGIAAMAFSLKKCYANFEDKTNHLWNLKNRMMDGLLRAVPGVSFNGATAPGQSIPTVLNTAFPSEETESMLLFNLDIHGISASGGSACTSGSMKGSHVLAGIGCDAARIANSVRFSFGVQNTVAEIDAALEKVASFVKSPV